MSGSRDNTWRAIAGTAGLGALIGGVIYGAVQLYEYYEENERNNAVRNAFADSRGLATRNECAVCRKDVTSEIIPGCGHKFHRDCLMGSILSQKMLSPDRVTYECPACGNVISSSTMEQFSAEERNKMNVSFRR